MISINGIDELDYAKIEIDDKWNDSDGRELLMHSIHIYPAKFPSFIASKAFEYAQNEGVRINTVADIFCGCGTVALEAKNHDYRFWGCDINPVATLIAKTKSSEYDRTLFEKYYMSIIKKYSVIEIERDIYKEANPRLKYWFTENAYYELYKLFKAINSCIMDDKYMEAFYCIFSSILKASSKWLTKSIKPQIDPNKKDINVFSKFKSQCNRFLSAISELGVHGSKIDIECANFLKITDTPKVDLIVTSPPYVTSYEYADLHQLSSLWLGYTDDYKELRRGTIGSAYNSADFIYDIKGLNSTGRSIVEALRGGGKESAKVKSVARYYADMQNAIRKCHSMLTDDGMVFFVVGDTEYKGVKIQNSKHLIETLDYTGFKDIKVAKRIISKGICVPYRDENGRFSHDKSKREVYHEEYIISGRA